APTMTATTAARPKIFMVSPAPCWRRASIASARGRRRTLEPRAHERADEDQAGQRRPRRRVAERVREPAERERAPRLAAEEERAEHADHRAAAGHRRGVG